MSRGPEVLGPAPAGALEVLGPAPAAAQTGA